MAITLTEFNIIKKYKELSRYLLKENSSYKEQDIITLLKFMFELTDKWFEYYVKDYFKKQYKYDWIRVTWGINDWWIDIEWMLWHKHTLIQCKQYKQEHVKDKEILKFVSDTEKYRKEIWKVLSLYFITTNWVNNEAYNCAKQHNISIKNYKDMIKMDKKLDVYKYIKEHKNDKEIVTWLNVYDILDKKYFIQAFWRILWTISYWINKFIFKNYELDYQKVEKYHPKKEKNIKIIVPWYSK